MCWTEVRILSPFFFSVSFLLDSPMWHWSFFCLKNSRLNSELKICLYLASLTKGLLVCSQRALQSLYNLVSFYPPSIKILSYYIQYSHCQLLWLLQYRNVHQLSLHLELSRACLVFLSCLSKLIKPPLVCQIPFRMCLSVTSTVAKQVSSHSSLQVTFLQTKCMTILKVDSFPHSRYLYFGATSFNAIWSFLSTDIAHRRSYFEIWSVFWSRNLGKYFVLQVAPQGDVSPFQVLRYFFKVSVFILYFATI